MEWSVAFSEKKIQVRLPARIPDDVPFEAMVAGKSVVLRWQKATRSFFLQVPGTDGSFYERPLPLRSVALDYRSDEGKFSLDIELGTSTGQALSASVSRYVAGQENRDKSAATKGATLRSPMTGKVLKVLAANRDQVEAGQTIFIIEAMKMENKIIAPIAGVITGIKLKDGDLVSVNTKIGQIS
jgi:biotin carboxyl carrier protein